MSQDCCAATDAGNHAAALKMIKMQVMLQIPSALLAFPQTSRKKLSGQHKIKGASSVSVRAVDEILSSA